MFEVVSHRLGSILDRSGRNVAAVTPPPPPSAPTRFVDFLAYGEDCLLAGRLCLASDRLTDVLNGQEEFEIVDIVAERLTDGHEVGAAAVTVPRHDLLVVQVAGPRGDINRRHRTRPYPIAAQVGPYRVRGLLHAMPGVDPEVVIHRRAPMVPLTDAWIDRPIGDERDVQRLGTLVLNRDHMAWVTATWDDSSQWLDIDPPVAEESTLVR